MHEWDKEINQKLQGLNLDPVREASIIEELRQHLNDCYAELIASGVSERDAYQQTLEELSDDELLARELKLVERQIHHNCFVIETNQRAKMITALWQDLRFGLRMLIKRPGFTLIAILTLALGMGVNTAIYSVLHAAFFASYPLTKPDEVLRVYGEDRNRNLAQLNMSVPKFQFVRDQQTVFSGLGAANYNGFTLLEQGTPVLINGAYVTANFLQTFGAVPIRGRFFEPQEEETASVAVLSESIWRARFNADPNIIGQSILLSGVNYTVVGIAPPLPAFWQAEVWVTNPFQLPGTSRDLLQRGVSFLAVAARLKSGVTQAQAQQELAIIAQRYQAENSGKADASWNLVTIPLRDDIIGTTRSPLFLLISTVGLVLLLACANVANLLLVNFAGRRREIALRQALGATRGLIVRQFLTESLIISILAAGLGLVLAYVSLPILIRLSQNFVPFYGEIQINQAVFLATVGVALLTGLLMGAYPAMQASRTDVASILREGGRGLTNTTGQHRIRNLLVSSQVAVSLLLLVCAVLLANSFFKLQKQPTGFSPDNVFTANLNLPQTRYQDNEAQARFYLSLNEELRQLPGVINASLIQGLPLSGNNSRSPYARAEGDVPQLKDRPLGLTRSVTPNYFATLGIALRAGRDFTERDTSDAPQAVILSSSTARKLFPDQDPLGRRVVMGSQNGRGLEMEVIGIVDDVRSQSLAQTPDVEFYRPVMQRPSAFMQLVVRTQGDAAAFAPTAQQLLKRLDAELPLNNSSTLAEVVAQSLGQQQLLFTLLGVFAALALVLSSVGIYSVVAYVTAQRTSEIGVRMAPGASAWNVLRLITSQGLQPVVIGMLIGIAGCLGLGRFIQNQLYGVSAFDPVTLIATAVSLLLIATIACGVPALRATKVDPLLALRQE